MKIWSYIKNNYHFVVFFFISLIRYVIIFFINSFDSSRIISPVSIYIISRNIIKNGYNYAEIKKYEIIRFNPYLDNNSAIINDIYLITKKKGYKNLNRMAFIIYQPEILNYIFFIKKQNGIKSLENLNKNHDNDPFKDFEKKVMKEWEYI